MGEVHHTHTILSPAIMHGYLKPQLRTRQPMNHVTKVQVKSEDL
jgi:hypothetical protein